MQTPWVPSRGLGSRSFAPLQLASGTGCSSQPASRGGGESAGSKAGQHGHILLGVATSIGAASSALHSRRSSGKTRTRSVASVTGSSIPPSDKPLRASGVPDSDPESLHWALELAVRAEDYKLAAKIQKAIPAAEKARPLRALQGLARQHAREAVDRILAEGSTSSERQQAIDVLQTLAMPPAAVPEAEDALHRVMLAGEEESVEMAEAALWSVWLVSGEDHIDELMCSGLNFMADGELAKAAEVFAEVTDLAPSYAEGWNKRATALFLANKFDESIAVCKRVLELNPRHFGCLSGLGICYLRKGDQESGQRWLRAALEVNPRIQDVHRIVNDLEAQSVGAVLKPRILEVMDHLKKESGSWVNGPAGKKRTVRTTWDAHRVEETENEKTTYFFRVRIECSEKHSGSPIIGAARYYVLKDSNGHVFQLSRLTPSLTAASFKIEPGRSYAYSFMVTLDEDLQAVQGGVMVISDEEIYEVELERLHLQDAPDMGFKDFERLNAGYDFVGRVEVSSSGN
mmetsp:Transcript_121/g.350  ORF Transcript_121/g.350 Transcript_121/m.350 type:complete len:515 (-) Transcript_121:77-1621(-)